jgi:predicted N-acetyltransferase YhbS
VCSVINIRLAEVFAMSGEIEIRAYQPGDEHGLVALFGRCFGRDIDVEHWLWKVQQPRTDYENVWVAIADGEHVGQYVGAPIRGWVKGQNKPAIMVFDVMVDPRMRRRGLLTSLGSRAHQEWIAAGVQYVIGLPNEKWGSRAAALGWQPVFPLQWLVWVLRPEAVFARRSGVPAIRHASSLGNVWRSLAGRSVRADPSICIEKLPRADSSLDEVADSMQHTYGTVRGTNWSRWRYFDCPSTRYHTLLAKRDGQPVGNAVYRFKGENPVNAIVPEILAVNDDQGVRNALMREIVDRCLAAGAETIMTLAVPGTPNYRAFRRCGFIPRRAAFTVQYVPLQSGMTGITDALDWDLMGGDFDVV